MSLVSIGSIVMDHRNPQLSWGTDLHGISPVTISGQSSVASVLQLLELANNPFGRQTRGGHTGVLEQIVFSGALVGSFTGDYLLESCTASAERPWSVTPFMPFTLNAAFIWDFA